MPYLDPYRARLLVVDDDPASLKLMTTLFHEEGMEVVSAQSVQHARDLLEENNWRFDLVVSDISMPKETGFDLLRWIKNQQEKQKADTLVILVTAARPEPANRVLGLSLGAVDYIVRPIDLKELVLRVVHALEQSQRVQTLRERLEDSENMAMTGRLMAASNHEVKNLAGIIHLSLSQLKRNITSECFAENPQATRSLDALERSANLLVKVVRDSSKMIGGQGHQNRPLDLAETVADVATMIRSRIRSIRLQIDPLPEEKVWVCGNEVHVKQILINFLLNANDAINELGPDGGGHVHVQFHLHATGKAEILIVDNGIGLKAAEEKTSFYAFSTTKSMRGGQGLGLWLCEKLAKGMDGDISLKSDGPGTGATSSLSLKICDKPRDDIEIERYFQNESDY